MYIFTIIYETLKMERENILLKDKAMNRTNCALLKLPDGDLKQL